jgi:methionyl aminopeptidase
MILTFLNIYIPLFLINLMEQAEDYKKAGEISVKAKDFAREVIKPGVALVDVADRIEDKIKELGGELAFPVNLSVDEVAAHYTPGSDDETEAGGLLKVDIGVHVNGAIADTAFSLDLTEDKRHKELILASEFALENALKIIKKNVTLTEIGAVIQKSIVDSGFSPIRNLSGHSLGVYSVHSGLTIPSYENNNKTELEEGAYAIEPFATSGHGLVYDGGKSGIYRLDKEGSVRDPASRKILKYIKDNYSTLPFCERWLTKQFGSRTRTALLFLEKAGILHHYAQLVEKSHAPVSQAEHTVLIYDNKVEVTTR